ncbi:MAG: DUF4405 domain-containing protein [Thermodesulfobacteriota bacterium]
MRRITSLTLVISGIIELVTSVILYIIPSGRVAYWSDYHIFGLSKTQWGDIHITVGTLMLVTAGIHIYYNWRPITTYLKNKAKKLTVFNKNFNIALIISFFVAIGTIYKLPPMNYILNLGEYFTDLGNEKYGEPPYGHAELSSLKMFCSKMNINLENATVLLKNADIKFADAKDSMLKIAKNNSKSPQQIYSIIKISSDNHIEEAQTFPDTPSPNFGKKSIKVICQTYNLSQDEVLTKLKDAGFVVQPGNTVKEIGENNNSNPMAIFEIIKEIANKDK